jgi:hypothetical protein
MANGWSWFTQHDAHVVLRSVTRQSDFKARLNFSIQFHDADAATEAVWILDFDDITCGLLVRIGDFKLTPIAGNAWIMRKSATANPCASSAIAIGVSAHSD